MSVGPRYIGEVELTWEEGTHRGPDVDEADPAGRKARWSLTGMAVDHRFFSAELLKATGINFDPVHLCWAENNLPLNEAPYELVLDRPVLLGLQPPFDRTIFAVPVNHARKLFDFLDRFAAGSVENVVMESLHQKMKLVDWPMVLDLTTMPALPPTVDIDLYGVSGKDFVYHWVPPRDPWREAIWLAKTPKEQRRLPRPGMPRTKTTTSSPGSAWRR